MPALSVLVTSSQVRNGENSSVGLHPSHPRRRKPGCETDIESTVPVEQERGGSIELNVLVASDDDLKDEKGSAVSFDESSKAKRAKSETRERGEKGLTGIRVPSLLS